jgi:small subunit ribosomal protein S6
MTSTRDYEAMFLLDNNVATADFDAAVAHVDGILQKNGCEIVRKEKWDERKLSYEIRGHRRATYYLVYFRAPTSAIREVNGDAELDETILRHLIIALEDPIEQHIELRAAERERLAEESRKSSLSGWGERKGGRREGGGRDDEYEVPDVSEREVESARE